VLTKHRRCIAENAFSAVLVAGDAPKATSRVRFAGFQMPINILLIIE
jgi:hypothetical protein